MFMARVNTGDYWNHVVLSQSGPSLALEQLVLPLTEYYSRTAGPKPQQRAESLHLGKMARPYITSIQLTLVTH